MLYPDYHNKKLIAHEHAQQFKDFHLCIKSVIMWYPDKYEKS